MALQYSVRRKSKMFSKPMPLKEALQWMREKARKAGPPWQLKRPGEPYGRDKRLYQIMTTLAWRLPRSTPGQVWRIKARADTPDAVVFAVRAMELEEKPVYPNGPGTDAIDEIHGATMAFCQSKGWRVNELGICVNKPGQHKYCNAWDGGCSFDNQGHLLPSDEIHRRILAVGEFLKSEGIKYRITGGKEGLPVLGVIVMDKFWEASKNDSIWHPYSGVAHVSHWHVSGIPSRYPGWI